MRHLISLKDQSREDLLAILELAAKLKARRKAGKLANLLPGQTLLMLFQKTSTRTRVSFEVAMTELGGHSVFLDSKVTQFALTDFRDEIRALMRFGDVLMFRAMKSADVLTAASCQQIPVIDACSEKYHPAQTLGDLLTMIEHSGGLDQVRKVAWLGIENNVSNTLKLACARLGLEVVLVTPEADKDSIDPELNRLADETGRVRRSLDLATALDGVDYIHTDTWMNMEFFDSGKVRPQFQDEYERRKKLFSPFQVNAALLAEHAPRARIMHCMPCHVGYEISRDAIDHPNSVIFDQAENRLHIEKAIILWLLGKGL
ncbi:MAG: ornithine carbamoyltransferase [Candidatus Riflebacteria bacterium]|nr:ornithine carbamoyltransferase [Candidatus Riflebacteria bacterium]